MGLQMTPINRADHVGMGKLSVVAQVLASY